MIQQFEILGYLAVAMLLGGVIGLEREVADKPAGLRTHMLVAGAAALLVGLGDVLIARFAMEDALLVRTDPVRIIEAIITGVSFLGAGTIFRHSASNKVKGLTTAASLLFVAGVGAATALEQFVLAIGGTFLVILVLRGVKYLEIRLAMK
ncbi:MAG: MgtC/SapB family protein [Chloroflexi bacterium]|nr:MgtC/SapB family protein [Chloroflexota bacterium]MCI0577441.1 MgtC/SapB family protein [Chloroflexota bacterium]MCI0649709.1 MgtC/SapB family protein [Chloroflexota bacterium]MCI0725439.1 MgtC/SapB family protein [Chloroflexota bacterium]